MKVKTIAAALAVLIFTFCGCNLQTTMDLELLREEAFQKGYEQGFADAEAKTDSSMEEKYDSGYSAGYEEGYSAGYTEGSLVSVNEKEESESSSEKDETVRDYVLNKNSMKFHYPSCESVGDIKESNKDYFTGTREDIIAEGYEPCGRCTP